MVFQPNSNNKTMEKLTVMAAVMFVCLMFIASNLSAVDYRVAGQVFRVTSEELADKTASDGTIDFAALETEKFPFVHIKIYRSGTSDLLGEGDAGINGQFHIIFTLAAGPPGPDVECRVYQTIDGASELQPAVDGAVNQYNTISSIGMWTTNKKLIVINDDLIDYMHGAVSTTPGVGLVFTRVGKVPVAYIPQLAAAGDKQGLADVPGVAPAYVPRFVDAPFGGRLLIFGDFGPPKGGCAGSQVDWYQVTVTNLGTLTPVILKDTLSKVKTIVSTTVPLTISNNTEKLGPFTGADTGGSVEGLYRVNKNSVLTYYSYPDLRAYWNTAGQSGLFKITVKYYRDLLTGTPTAPDVAEMTVGSNPGDCFDTVAPGTPIGELIVRVNNQPLDVRFRGIFLKDGSDYYMVGGVKYDYNDEGLCSIMNLKQLPRKYGIEIDYTAHHHGNYMWRYSLTAIPNDRTSTVTFINEVYPPSPPSILWEGTPAAGDTQFKAFGEWPKACAYIFDLVTWSRVQDGYIYIQKVHKRRTYYIDPN